MVALAVVGLIVFVRRVLRAKEPMVDLRIFRARNLSVGTAMIFLTSVLIYGLGLLTPQFLQQLMGYTSLSAGIATAPSRVGSCSIHGSGWHIGGKGGRARDRNLRTVALRRSRFPSFASYAEHHSMDRVLAAGSGGIGNGFQTDLLTWQEILRRCAVIRLVPQPDQ